MTGKVKTKSAGTARRKDAAKAAGKLEAELREGRYRGKGVRVEWDDFRDRYEDEVLSGLADTTVEKVSAVFNVFERIVSPRLLQDVTAARVSYYQAELRKLGRSEQTIKGNLAHLKSSLNWAVRMGMLKQAPRIDMPKRAKGQKVMKGRPITAEEFERMLDKTQSVVGKSRAAEWKHLLEGMWLSGLRLRETIELWWDRDDRPRVDLSGRHSMFNIPSEFDKGQHDRVLPMAPEFAEFLEKTLETQRTGRVFDVRSIRGKLLPAREDGRVVSSIGKAAGVKVKEETRGDEAVVKYASAHDLRRSFGERWAARVMPQQLMVLMRHEFIETTLRFYVGRNADTTAAILWEAHRQNGREIAPSNKRSNNGVLSNADTVDELDVTDFH